MTRKKTGRCNLFVTTPTEDIEQQTHREGDTDLALLQAIYDDAFGSQRKWADAIGISHQAIGKKLKVLQAKKLVEEGANNRWHLTTKSNLRAILTLTNHRNLKMFIGPPKSIFEPAPTGHLAILVKLIDLGWQPNTFQGETKVQRQGLFTWELPLKLNSQGRPFLISKTLHLSMHEKATFRSWSENMMGRVFTKADLVGANRFNAKDLLGRSCMIKFDHGEREGKVYAKIANLIQVPEGIPEPHQVNDCVYFTLDPGEFDKSVFESLSSWTKEKIQSSENYENLRATQPKQSEPSEPKKTTVELIDEMPF